MPNELMMQTENFRGFDRAIGAHPAIDASLLDRGLLVPFEQFSQHECHSLIRGLPSAHYAWENLTSG